MEAIALLAKESEVTLGEVLKSVRCNYFSLSVRWIF